MATVRPVIAYLDPEMTARIERCSTGLPRYDSATFTLTIDLTTDGFGGSRRTLLADARHQLRLDTTKIVSIQGVNLTDDDLIPTDLIRRSDFHRLEADFDGDTDVDLYDRDLLFQHYGTLPGQTGYDPAYDLTADGIVDLQDYGRWKKQYGKRV